MLAESGWPRLTLIRTRFNPVAVPMLFVSPILGAPELTIPSKSFGKED